MASVGSYYGGKARKGLLKWIVARLPVEKNSLYCEPFAGMLSVLLAREKSEVEMVNDLNGDIMAFWTALRDNKDELRDLCYATPVSRDLYEECFGALKSGRYRDDVVRRGWATYVVLGQSYMHGMGENDGWRVVYNSDGFRINPCHRFLGVVDAVVSRIKDVFIENCCAVELLDRLKKHSHAIIYCDPPYIGEANIDPYGDVFLNLDDFRDVLKKQKGRVAVSGYGDVWDDLGWERHEFKTYYTPVARKGVDRIESRTEVLWTNYSVALGKGQLKLW